MQQCIKIYYSIFIWSSARFGRHTAHHQETKTALAASGFSYVEGCWTLSGTYCVWQRPTTTRLTTFHIWKTRGCQCSFSLLMMGGVSPETCWASYKYGIIKFDTLLHLVGFFSLWIFYCFRSFVTFSKVYRMLTLCRQKGEINVAHGGTTEAGILSQGHGNLTAMKKHSCCDKNLPVTHSQY